MYWLEPALGESGRATGKLRGDGHGLRYGADELRVPGDSLTGVRLAASDMTAAAPVIMCLNARGPSNGFIAIIWAAMAPADSTPASIFPVPSRRTRGDRVRWAWRPPAPCGPCGGG